MLLEHVTPEALALTLAVQEEVIQRADEARRLRHLQVERAQYEAELAQRRYLKVDPDNRLVASVLEAEWHAKLLALEEARAIEERYNQSDQQRVSAEERADIEQVPQRFRQFWTDPKTTARERKRAVRRLDRRCHRKQSRAHCCPHPLHRGSYPNHHGVPPSPLCPISLDCPRHPGRHGSSAGGVYGCRSRRAAQ